MRKGLEILIPYSLFLLFPEMGVNGWMRGDEMRWDWGRFIRYPGVQSVGNTLLFRNTMPSSTEIYTLLQENDSHALSIFCDVRT